ncbi:MAG TPA: MjaI family restriction endonuclease [Pseudothermotoga sp.]|nr:MjaI family restriction endonuclease [Pseudothermotoga sp.]HOK83775.1 MjaI family restriction endonuclease [Pseudothermotoga sp.]HPP70322.1 MjaI family restriction endonuclease [Pseudothermotoga sp.]
MPKEWILNMSTNRWGLNKASSVGPVSQWIRECNPRNVQDWEEYYYEKLPDLLKKKGIPLSPEEYIKDLGRKLYTKITEVIQAEIMEVTEKDCIDYIRNLLINRTFNGYRTEIETVYGNLQSNLRVEIKPAPEEWDRRYNVDFYIQVGQKYIGLQIKPITYQQTPQVHEWKEWLRNAHEKFEKRFGGKVFTVFSIKKGNKKEIYNQEVIEEIRKEIERLKKEK